MPPEIRVLVYCKNRASIEARLYEWQMGQPIWPMATIVDRSLQVGRDHTEFDRVLVIGPVTDQMHHAIKASASRGGPRVERISR